MVVWVIPHFHDEHRQALDWLNRRTDEGIDFFGIELSLVRIGNSAPAPVFDLVLQPARWRRSNGREGRSLAGRTHHQFFTRMFEEIIAAGPATGYRSSASTTGSGFFSGPFGFYDVSFTDSGGLRAGVLLDTSWHTTKALFDDLIAERSVRTAVPADADLGAPGRARRPPASTPTATSATSTTSRSSARPPSGPPTSSPPPWTCWTPACAPPPRS